MLALGHSLGTQVRLTAKLGILLFPANTFAYMYKQYKLTQRNIVSMMFRGTVGRAGPHQPPLSGITNWLVGGLWGG